MNGANSNTSGSNVAAIDYSPKGGSDKVSNSVMEEIVRRLVVTFENSVATNVVFSPTAPTDKTKAWWQTDSITGIPIGRPKAWNEVQGLWLESSSVSTTYTPPAHRNTSALVAAGTSTVEFTFNDIGTSSDYCIILTPTTYYNGAWNAAPVSFPTAYGYVVTNKTSTGITVVFQGVPTGGLNFEVDVYVR